MTQIISDLHIHSKYSRAVSYQMDIDHLALWAVKKGINLIGTGDFTHPLWFRELQNKLEEKSPGIYKLKNSDNPTQFLLTSEISSIYSQAGKTRRIHNTFFAPSLETVGKINDALIKRGINLMSDGRPIIGLSSIQLAELIWSVDEKVILVPAHVWTPWFSLYGSKSGFDSMEECFGKFSKNIFAIETGLSSDPAMNWEIPELLDRSILSFSDAHSPAKLGREATVFKSKTNANFSFKDLTAAIKRDKNSDWQISYTIEFHPEEGKYHYSGHRVCNITQSPQQTQKTGVNCPVCGRPLTLGVMHRVGQLSKNPNLKIKQVKNSSGTIGIYPPKNINQPPYVMLVPLLEIIAESAGVATGSKKVLEEYDHITSQFGSEFDILLKTDLKPIAKVNQKLADGIQKVRSNDININPGFDGVFGVVKIWGEKKPELAKTQMSLF